MVGEGISSSTNGFDTAGGSLSRALSGVFEAKRCVEIGRILLFRL